MSDKLTDLLRERLAGHEMDVPSGTWEHVSGQLAASASGGSLRESLQDKFSGHEVEVDPSAWANISGQLAQGTGSGSSFSTGWIAAGVAAVAVTAALLLWNNETKSVAIAPERAPIIIMTTAPTENASSVMPTVPELAEVAPPEQPVKAVIEHLASPTAQPETQVVPEPTTKPDQEKAPVSAAEATVVTRDAPSKETENSAVKPNVPVTTPATMAPKSGPGQQPKPEMDAQYQAPNDNHPEVTTPEVEMEKDPLVLGSGQAGDATDLLIPTAFSPNGDGINDKWKVVTTEEAKVDIRIYSMSGMLVFEANDLRQTWDGRLPNGSLADEGNYTCLVKLFKTNGQAVVRTGQIHLFR